MFRSLAGRATQARPVQGCMTLMQWARKTISQDRRSNRTSGNLAKRSLLMHSSLLGSWPMGGLDMTQSKWASLSCPVLKAGSWIRCAWVIEDFDALFDQGPADVLISHEAPSCHRYGFKVLDELAELLQVKTIVAWPSARILPGRTGKRHQGCGAEPARHFPDLRRKHERRVCRDGVADGDV